MFEGYTPETVDFLWGIRLNNNREWFLEHKQDYVNHLYAPTKALGQSLGELIADKPGNLLKVSRIYRDARRHYPVPYKESLWICIRRDVEWWAENPCLYFEINPDRIHYGFFFWRIRPAVMERIRQDMTAHPQEFLKMIRSVERKTGRKITADELYKRPREAPDKKLAPYFQWKGQIGCVAEEVFTPETFGPALGDRVKTLLSQLMPLYDYYNSFTDEPQGSTQSE